MTWQAGTWKTGEDALTRGPHCRLSCGRMGEVERVLDGYQETSSGPGFATPRRETQAYLRFICKEQGLLWVMHCLLQLLCLEILYG
jgi:hypothetical protein